MGLDEQVLTAEVRDEGLLVAPEQFDVLVKVPEMAAESSILEVRVYEGVKVAQELSQSRSRDSWASASSNKSGGLSSMSPGP